MNDVLRIRTLTEKFFDGGTTLDEEQELYDFYRQDNIPEDLRASQELFRDLAAMSTLSPAMRRMPLRRSARRWWLPAAAAVALLIVGGATLCHFQREDECVAYIYGQRVTDRDVVLGEMQKTMSVLAADGSDVVEEQLKAMFGN